MKFLQKYFPFYEATTKKGVSIPLKSNMHSKIWLEGYIAQKQEGKKSSNPYPKDSENFESWNEGWTESSKKKVKNTGLEFDFDIQDLIAEKYQIVVPKKISAENLKFAITLGESDAFKRFKNLQLKVGANQAVQTRVTFFKNYAGWPNAICRIEDTTGDVVFNESTGEELGGKVRIKRTESDGKTTYTIETFDSTDPGEESYYSTGKRKVVYTEAGDKLFRLTADFNSIDDCMNWLIAYALASKATLKGNRQKFLRTYAKLIADDPSLIDAVFSKSGGLSGLKAENQNVKAFFDVKQVMPLLQKIYGNIGLQFTTGSSEKRLQGQTNKAGTLGDIVKKGVGRVDAYPYFREPNIINVEPSFKSGSLLNIISGGDNYIPIEFEFIIEGRHNWEKITDSKIELNMLVFSKEHMLEIVLMKIYEYFQLYGVNGGNTKKYVPQLVSNYTKKIINYLRSGNVNSKFFESGDFEIEEIFSQDDEDELNRLEANISELNTRFAKNEIKLLEDLRELKKIKNTKPTNINRPKLLKKQTYLLFDQVLRFENIDTKINDETITKAEYYSISESMGDNGVNNSGDLFSKIEKSDSELYTKLTSVASDTQTQIRQTAKKISRSGL